MRTERGGTLSRWPGAVEAAMLLGLGAAMTPAFVHTAWAWPLAVLAPAILVWWLGKRARNEWRRAALGCWLFGIGWLAAGTWWLFVSMHRYGGLPAPLAVLAVLALAAALSLYLAAAAAAWVRWRPGSPWADAGAWAALWLLAELARGVLFTGFPWVASGYAMVDSPLADLAPWIGVYGIGAVLAFAAAALARLAGPHLAKTAGPAVVAVLAFVALAVLPVASFTRSTGELDVALLQTAVKQDEKFVLDRLPETLGWVGAEIVKSPAALTLAPETAVPLLPSQLEDFAPGYWPGLVQHFPAGGARVALVGKPLGSFSEGYTNSVVALGTAAPYRYDKHHLVPFGEFVPWGFRWFVRMMNIPLGDFSRGRVDSPSLAFAGQRIAPNICYEDLFGEELAVRFVDPANAPTVLANLSNIAWFGDTVAIEQHLNITRLRTLELQRPMLRATNTGATAIVDHGARVTAMLEPQTRDVLTGKVEGRDGVTPYAAWAGRFGLWPLGLAVLVVLAGALAAGRHRA